MSLNRRKPPSGTHTGPSVKPNPPHTTRSRSSASRADSPRSLSMRTRHPPSALTLYGRSGNVRRRSAEPAAFPVFHTRDVRRAPGSSAGTEEPMTTTSASWTERFVEVAGGRISMMTAGRGDPLLVLHRDIGNPGQLPFYDRLAQQFTVYVPSHPGYDRSDRPDWMRGVRDIAVVYQCLIKDLGIDRPALVGLGLGGWIAAEMATMSPRQFARL